MTVVRAPDRGVLVFALLAALSAFIVSTFQIWDLNICFLYFVKLIFRDAEFILAAVRWRLHNSMVVLQVGILIGVFGVGAPTQLPPKPDRWIFHSILSIVDISFGLNWLDRAIPRISHQYVDLSIDFNAYSTDDQLLLSNS